MASFIVTTLADDNDVESFGGPYTNGLSLREAIGLANGNAGADTITFEASLSGGTILLTNGQLNVTEALTIDGDINDDHKFDITIDANSLSRVLTTSADLTLEGLTLTGGRTNGPGATGGGVQATAGAGLNIIDSTVSNNRTIDAGSEGGGIYSYSGNITLTNSTVSGNSATGISSDGGGIYSSSGTITLTDSTVSGNTTAEQGGGIISDSGNIVLTRSTVSGNAATGDGDGGGGLSSGTGSITLTDSTVSGNRTAGAGGDGGGISSGTGVITLTNSTVSGNSTSGMGGDGAGIFSSDANIVLNNSTVSGNRASAFNVKGGGINALNGTVTLNNSIVLGNSAATDAEIHGTLVNTGSVSIVGGTPANVFAAIDGVTGGGLLADNGGPVMTIELKASASNPALDASGAGATTKDARGEFVQNFTTLANANGNARDLGAFELQRNEALAQNASLVVTTLDDVADPLDGKTSLREAVTFAIAPSDADNDGSPNDTITFVASLSGGTITLGGSEISLIGAVTVVGDIDGDHVPDITIDADGQSRIFNAFGNITLRGLIITGGMTSGDTQVGGAIRATGPELNVSDSVITDNHTTGNNATGGAISMAGGDIVLNNSTVSGNSTAGDFALGGGIYSSAGSITLTNSTISGNSTTGANARGGGLSGSDGPITLNNTTISGNTTIGEYANGGGLNGLGSYITLNNSTVSGNSTAGATAKGGGIFWDDGLYTFGNLTLNNSIVIGNVGAWLDEIYPSFVNHNSLVGGNARHIFAQIAEVMDGNGAATGAFAGVLADNGGSVQTIALLAVASNPALDAGGAGATVADARGLSVVDSSAVTNINGNARDLGAFELQIAVEEAPSLVVTTLDDVVDAFDFQTSLREAIAFANDAAAGDLADGDADNDGNANDTITFDASLSGGTVYLTQGTELVIDSDVTVEGDIDGDGIGDIAVNANSAAAMDDASSRVLRIGAGVTVRLDGLTISGGMASKGGGIAVAGSSLHLTNSSVTDNFADNDGGGIFGAAIASITIENSTVADNTAFADGGGISLGSASMLYATNATVANNSAAMNGGGIFGGANTVITFENTNIAGNTAGLFGGGIYNSNRTTLRNSTITGNDSSSGGAGIDSGLSPLYIYNSIVLGNYGTDLSGTPLAIANTITSGTPSEVFAAVGTNGGGLLADNGGPVQTVALKSDNANPALDAGDDGLAPMADARGIARFDQQGVANNGANISDLGAFELGAQVNLDPAAGNDFLEGTEDEALIIPFADLIYNDFNSDGPQPLTIVSVDNAVNGTAVISGTSVIFTPAAGFTGTASFTYVVSDGGGGYGGAVVQIEVAPAPVIEPPVEGNQPPEVLPDDVTLYTLEGKAIGLHVSASDPDDDPLSFSAGSAAHGMVTGGSGGSFVYTPDAGFLGTDGFVVTVSDGNGGTDTQAVTVEVLDLSGDPDWVLLTTSGFAGEIGGTGAVFGTAGHQDVTILDLAGLVVLDGSFNGGGDIVRLHGNAGDWQVAVEGSMAVFNDGDTLVGIPAGPSGLAILFDDGARELVIDGTMQIGGQSVTEAFAVIGAAPDGTSLPAGGIDPDASAALILMPGAEVAAGGELFVFGTPGAETVTATQGALHFDGSFNGGGDTIAVGEAPGDFTVRLDGSTAVFEGSDTSLAVPIGPAGATLSFGGTDAALLYDADLGAAFIGSQEITMTPAPLTFA